MYFDRTNGTNLLGWILSLIKILYIEKWWPPSTLFSLLFGMDLLLVDVSTEKNKTKQKTKQKKTKQNKTKKNKKPKKKTKKHATPPFNTPLIIKFYSKLVMLRWLWIDFYVLCFCLCLCSWFANSLAPHSIYTVASIHWIEPQTYCWVIATAENIDWRLVP